LARARHVPVLLHIHGGRFDLFLDQLGPAMRLLARCVARCAAFVVVLSDTWRERLAPRLPGAHLVVVENGVALSPTIRMCGTSNEPTVVFLGAICKAKGVVDLVRAAGKLTQRARVVLLGPQTEEGIGEQLRELAARFGISERLLMPGAVDGAAKAEWLARATVFVLPSHSEGQPISVLEAMAAGCAIVATTVGAVPDAIRDGHNGLLVAAGDVEALASAIDRLLADAALRETLGQQARRDCAARFSIDRTAAQLATLYASLHEQAFDETNVLD